MMNLLDTRDDNTFDMVVVGAGSGGVRCARVAARLGARVACIEERFWGGTCVNVGCVPKKIYVLGSEFAAMAERSRGFGWSSGEAHHDWSMLQRAMAAEVARLNGIYDSLLGNAGVERIWGRARLVDKHTVHIGERVIKARNIVIATGSRPVMPDFSGAAHLLNSDDFFALTTRPRRVAVIGGGYIAVELAGILNALGAHTTLIYRGDRILRGFDGEVREHVQACLQQRGIEILLQRRVQGVEVANDEYHLRLDDESTFTVDKVFAATGRKPNTQGIGLETVGVALDEHGAIVVDEHYQSSVPGIFAVGDVLHRKPLTPVALAEGMYVAHRLFGEKPSPVRYDSLATAVFSQPPVATVGLTEEECREQAVPFKVFRSRFTPMSHAFASQTEKVFMKILVHASSDRVLGMHMVGDQAAEIMQGFAAALTCGVTKRQLDSTIGIHPTVAEELVTMREVSAVVITEDHRT